MITKVRPINLPQDHPSDYMRRLVVMLYEYLRELSSAVNQVIDALSTSSGGASWTEAEIDFGAAPVYSASFTITDAAITSTSKVQVLPCGKAATGRTADDWAWDGATMAANPGTGSATCYAVFVPGPVVGKRKIQYSVGA
jgi:hypothetical protein